MRVANELYEENGAINVDDGKPFSIVRYKRNKNTYRSHAATPSVQGIRCFTSAMHDAIKTLMMIVE